MTDSHTVGLQPSTIALMRVPLKRLVVPAVAIFTSGSIAGCFAYFVVAAPSVSPTEASATGVQWREIDKPADLDRPANEDTVKAFPLANEGHGALLTQNSSFKHRYQTPNCGPN